MIQENVRMDPRSGDYSPTLYQMVQANKSLKEIKDALIDIEKLLKSRQAHAHSVRDFVRSKYDRFHNPIDSPQRAGWRYRHEKRSRSPSQGTRYGHSSSGTGASSSESRRDGDRGRDRSPFNRQFEDSHGRTRSSSPHDSRSGTQDFGSRGRSATRDQHRSDRRRHRSPTPTSGSRGHELSGRSRSPSPGMSNRPRKHVGFRKPLA